MSITRSIIGSFLFGLGVMGIVWFFRNLMIPRVKKAMFYLKTKEWIIIVWNIIFIVGGMYIYSDFERLPLVALVVGLLAGLYISR